MDGNALEPAAAARKRSFIDGFARYALAFTLSAPVNFPVTFVYAGRLETPGGTADALAGVGPGDFAIRLFIDTRTHLPLMMNYRDGGRDVQLWLKEYKPEGGILFPHVVTWVADGELIGRIPGAAVPHQSEVPAGEIWPVEREFTAEKRRKRSQARSETQGLTQINSGSPRDLRFLRFSAVRLLLPLTPRPA